MPEKMFLVSGTISISDYCCLECLLKCQELQFTFRCIRTNRDTESCFPAFVQCRSYKGHYTFINQHSEGLINISPSATRNSKLSVLTNEFENIIDHRLKVTALHTHTLYSSQKGFSE